MARNKLGKKLVQQVWERAGARCEYCRWPSAYNVDPMHVEHILPVSRRGADSPDNLALSCAGCNLSKGSEIAAVDPDSGDRVPIFHPRQDRWEEHFSWSLDGILVVGITPTGRATVVALELNREALMKLRDAIPAVGNQ